MSKLNSTSLILNNKEISGVETILTADNTKIPTSKALYDYLKNKGIKPFAPTSLSVSGSWARQQNRTRVNLTGLTFTATYADGTRGTVAPSDVNVSPITWNVKTSEAQRVTFTYTVKGTTVSTTSTVGVGIDLERLEVSGDWSNVQFYGTTPDLAGLTFTAYYNDDSSGQVPPGQISVSPSTWSGLGTQTATFSYTDGDVTKATTKDATVVRKLTGLTVGPWIKTQYTGQAVDYTGMTFTASYNNNTTATVTPSDYDPKTWSSTAGTQTCTFYYSENGITVSVSKSASVVEPWSAVAITLTNPNSGLVFRSISGNLYTNSTCTSTASTNTKYTGITFYYKSNETKPTGSYLYNYGDGPTSSSEPSRPEIQNYYDEGCLTACLGTEGYCWSSSYDPDQEDEWFFAIKLSSGSWYESQYEMGYHRVREKSF